jgi:dihydroorotate dehydrogenase
MYSLLRQILFCFPPEQAHYISMNLLKTGCSIEFIKKIIAKKFCFHSPSLEKKLFNLNFKNPVGLGAGFDKNALYLNELEALGFGFVEIGTVTPKSQEGNPQPRLFRLPKDKALINRMGFNNDGVDVVKTRLEDWNKQKTKNESRLIVGGNIGKNKITENADAWKDYNICFTELFDVVDYFVVNVSSPNTPGLRELQDKEMLRKILSELQNINQGKTGSKSLLLKIAPDLTLSQFDDIVALTNEVKLDGLVIANTTISRENLLTEKTTIDAIANGGLSGKPLKQKSDEVLKYIHQQTKNNIPIIASGSIFNAKDAKDKINAGASLERLYL